MPCLAPANVPSLLTSCLSVQIGFVASFCSKLSDTVSSEVGKAYGKTTYLVTTFQRVPRGTEGAVSLEGTAAGVAAAALFSGVALAIGQVRDARRVLAPWSTPNHNVHRTLRATPVHDVTTCHFALWYSRCSVRKHRVNSSLQEIVVRQ